MARRAVQDVAVAGKKDPRFNNPFVRAQDALKKVVERPKVAPAPPPVPVATKRTLDAEAALFADEMSGVAPLEEDRRGRVGMPEPTALPPSRRESDDAEAYASLADLIEGSGPFDVADTDEYIEGIAPGLDRRLLRRLRRGDYAVQGHLDLHGMTRDEALPAVDRFVASCRAGGKRCVLLIHGRGNHSKDQVPVLKERVRAWLERGRVSKQVLAFSTARPCDGGAGAVYVLLRK